MSKLSLIVSLSLIASLAACMEKPTDVPDIGTEAVAEVQSNLIDTHCDDKYADDLAACTATYNACKSQAQTWWDRAACAIAYSACVAQATAKYIGCIRGLLQPAQPQPLPGVPVPGQALPDQLTPSTSSISPVKTSWLEDALAPGPATSSWILDPAAQNECAAST